MDHLPTTQSVTSAHDAFRTLVGVAIGALTSDEEALTEIKILLVTVRQGMQTLARAGRTERTRYLALTAMALEEAEGWLHKAQMED